MVDVVTLGPAGTFSDTATKRFFRESDYTVSYEKTIKQVFEAIHSGECSYGVVPVENMSEGFVQPTLEALLRSDIDIVGELKLSVQFSFVANVSTLEEVKTLFVQPVALGQCSEFLASLDGVTTIQTNSNIESFDNLETAKMSGAIIPRHTLESSKYSLKIEQVSDYRHNETRFYIIKSREAKSCVEIEGCPIKSSLIIRDDKDHTGVLNFIAGSLSSEDINITSIISRPTKEVMGRYHFFLEVDGSIDNPNLSRAIEKISKLYPVKFLGSFCRAE